MRTIFSNVSFMLAAGVIGGCLGTGTDQQSINVARLRGALFTTLVDGTRVDANIYDAKEDVYLDGGPGSGAPSLAASLPAGNYYFQVTDPSGHTLLSSDAIECREFHVDGNGVITYVVPATGGCEHATGEDADHSELGAITVQLMPYDDTPNHGGEYKAWVTPVGEYISGEGRFGFISSESKTDNYKVRRYVQLPYCGDNEVNQESETCDGTDTPDGYTCRADCTYCGDGIQNDGEQCDDGNNVDGDGCSSSCTIEKKPCCGDGVLDEGEQCDDGNNVDGDGCSASCTIEVCEPV